MEVVDLRRRAILIFSDISLSYLQLCKRKYGEKVVTSLTDGHCYSGSPRDSAQIRPLTLDFITQSDLSAARQVSLAT